MDIEWFSVHLEARAPAGAPDVVIADHAADVLMDLLEEHDGIVSVGAGSWDATASVEATGALEAAILGGGLIEKMAAKAGIPAWPVVRTEVVRQDVLDAENEEPTLPELVSAPEVAEILGVSPQRVHELVNSHPEFPKPVYELRTGRLWLRDAIEAFGQRWERKRGRPDRPTLMRQRVTSALLDSGITVADTKVFLGHDQTVMMQLAAGGPSRTRQATAAKVIAALADAGLGIAAEANSSAENMEAYLADGGPVEVFELSSPARARA